ncbi:MAG: serine/threonine protein kinase [Proteobacteria bacterium]|nr:serine/threonine protein kinase [Pseudomonadota bacterium]
MAICPLCRAQGEEGKQCSADRRYFVDERELARAPEGHLLGELVGGQYVPLSLIGEGGMGRIYKARAKYTGKDIALKILKSEYVEDETLRERFFREAEVVSSLEHPNIVKLYGCAPDENHNTIYMAMELLSGRTLFEALRRDLPDLATMLRWFVSMSSALGEAHKKGIFHRDLKPENIFIIRDDDGIEHPKVLDFGFARLQGAAKKLTMVGVAFGTPHYMSPEQAMGMTEITAAVDVYAMGVMLYQAVSGQVPFDSKTNSPMEVMYAQVNDAPPPCVPRPEYKVSKRLIRCIEKCMKKEPGERYPDGTVLYAELSEIEKEAVSLSSEHERATVIMEPVAPPVAKAKVKSDGLSKISISSLIFLGIFVILVLVILVIFLK